MNHLPVAGEDEWHLPQHAHVVVYEDDGEGLLTIYDCGAAQKPPSAQVTGNLVRVDADHELVYQPTGYIVKLRERARLERQGENHWVIRAEPAE
jgi:hypothetical protein